jgi:hypothetical protein
LWELKAHLNQLEELPADKEYTRAKALPEESALGRSQTLQSDRLRQPTNPSYAGSFFCRQFYPRRQFSFVLFFA